MYRLSLKIAFLVLLALGLHAQSPHGKGFKMDCAKCHDSGSWSFSSKRKFEHGSTGFQLSGGHKNINCKACHTKLSFVKTLPNCISCHTDMHNQTVGNDCARCHTTQSWIVENITKLHEQTSFPLVGVHKTIDCNQCHKSETNIRFKPIGQTCIDCHSKDVKSSKNPNHVKLNLSSDCSACHSTTVTGWVTKTFPDHNKFYPLTGAHAAIAKDCEKCHIGGNFNNTPTECIGCHKTDFGKTTNPNHAKLNLSNDCSSCHSTAIGWSPATFPVHNNFYPLTGAHVSIANNCVECHKGDYNNTKNDCNSCHSADYKKTINPNHNTLKLSTDCASCHTTAPDWAPATFTAHNDFYPLTGAHATLKCNECHKGGNYNNTPKDCNACHNAVFKSAKEPNHEAMGFSTDCSTCHSTAIGWSPTTFNHNKFYPLTGGHATIANDCNKCHTGSNYKNPSTDCNACHNESYKKAKSPNHEGLRLATNCASCHTTNPGWRPSTFNHNTYYPLTGAHATIANDCSKCHTNGVSNTSTDCNSCHSAAYNSAKNPNHAAMGLSTNCASCHTTAPGWSPSTFDHNKFYTLTGAHATIAKNCNSCHTGSNYKNPSTDCNTCHNSAYKSANNPNHATLGLSTNCVTCHTTNPGWKPSTFNHNTYYPLTGAHATIANDCSKCHVKSVSNTPTDCNACHNDAYKSANNPNHSTLKLSTDCASCHTTNTGWKPTTFNHNNYYPLTGAHANIASNCVQCHSTGVSNTPTDCNSCHNGAYKSANNPNHATLGLSTNCVTCHTTNPGWKPSTFNHNTYYPLTGAHATIANDCSKCHVKSVSNTPTDCNACHNNAYKSANNPNHSTLKLSTDCASCHTTNTGWKPTTFNHNNYYPLTGAHANIASNCVQCHSTGVANTPSDCNSCHNGAYNAARNPNHAASGFSKDCASCHTTNPGWSPSTFDHNKYYSLTGAHANIASNCTKCHSGGNFNNTPTDCNSCHSGAYNSARSPNHATIKLSSDCASCHSTNPGWKPSTFNHNNYYPLIGAHASIASNCTQCHSGGSFNNNTCIACHTSDYNKATPNHKASGFPTNCTDCHSQNAWKPATWDHDSQYFPIYSGSHKGQWNNCNECHTSSGNFGVFNCLNCHKKNETDKDHKGVKNYNYDSNSCFACHPKGKS